MDKYLALDFTFDTQKFKDLNEFSKNADKIEKYGISNEDYHHQDFPFYVNDDKNVIAHAAWIIKELQQVPENEKDSETELKKALAEDFNRYLDCMQFGLQGERDIARQFIEIMFAFDLEKDVVERFWEYESGLQEPEFHFYAWQVLNFDKLFIKAGNRSLFVKNEIKTAINLYQLAFTEWVVDENEKIVCDDEGLSKKEITEWKKTYSILLQLSSGNLLSNKNMLNNFATTKITKVYELYEKIYFSFKSNLDDINILESTNNFFEVVNPIIKNISKPSDELKILFAMIHQIYKKTLIPILYQLSEEAEANRILYRSKIEEKLFYLEDTNYENIIQFYKKDRSDKNFLKFFLFIKTSVISRCILNELLVKNEIPDSAYYTSLETFSYMLKPVKKEQLGKLSVMNISYMNDPNEGMTIKRFLYGSHADNQRKTERKDIKVPYVFLKCFTSKIDYLPMWEMYGNHAEGCCLVIDWQKTFSNCTGADNALYHVCYIHKTKNSYNIRKEENPQLFGIKRIKYYLFKLHKIAKKITLIERPLFEKLLGELLYLFKDDSYSYEQEVRILYLYSKAGNNFEHTPQPIPKLFISTDYFIQLKEIILGPKVSDISNRIPYLQEQVEKMCKEINTDFPEITISNIDYR